MVDRRKAVGRLFLLTVASTLMLMPPFVLIFNHDFVIFGIPQIVLFLFAVWVMMIVGTALLTRKVPKDSQRYAGEGDS